MAELDQKAKKFIGENPYVGIVTTLRKDGSPHSTVVWVDVTDDGTLSFNTARERAKDKNLKSDDRLSLVVVDPQDAYKWVAVTGRGELTEEGADPQIDRLAKKYLGADEYPWRTPDQTRVSVRITPERVETSGLDE
jgi:PPOX class probable F420-dependent enzyme